MLTKVCIVKATVFPVVMYTCESWTIKKAECQELMFLVLEKTLESPLDSKEIKPVNLKGNQPWIFNGRTDAEAEAPVLWPPNVKSWLIGKDLDAGKDWRKKGVMRWLDSITKSMDMNLSKLLETVEDPEAWYAAVHRITKSQTRLSDSTTKNILVAVCQGEVDGSCKENCSIIVLLPSNKLHPSGAPTPSANRETHSWMKPKFPTTYTGPSTNGVPPVSCSSRSISPSHSPPAGSTDLTLVSSLCQPLSSFEGFALAVHLPWRTLSWLILRCSSCTLRSPFKCYIFWDGFILEQVVLKMGLSNHHQLSHHQLLYCIPIQIPLCNLSKPVIILFTYVFISLSLISPTEINGASQVALVVENLPANAGYLRLRKTLWSRAWQPTPVFLPGESHGQRSLVGYSP